MKHPIRLAVVFAAIAVSNVAEGQVLMGTAFTYQGRLSEAGAPVNSDVDLEFTLWNDPVGSLPANQIAPPVAVFDQAVSEGLFTAVLDFGPAAFNGDGRWLEIRVGPAGGILTTLSPRQELTPAPYALSLPGLYTQQTPSSPNLIGGRADNSVTSGVAGATIGGGGSAGVDNNRVTDDFGTIGGGDRNQAGNNSGPTTDRPYATVGGGQNNSASGNRSTVSGGESNSASGQRTFVGGGLSNQSTGTYATISGGRSNLASGSYTTVAGGGPSDTGNVNNTRNRVTDDYGAIGGGGNNQAGDNAGTSADHAFATVSGGEANIASGAHSAVPGGQFNTAAGSFSLAAGRRAKAMHDGSVVIADSTDEDFSSTASDQFLIRATSGVGIGTISPQRALDVAGTIRSSGGTGGQLEAVNPNNQAANVAFGWLNDVARIRVGGTSPGGGNGFDIQGPGDLSLMRVLDNGNVGIGTTGPSVKLEVNGAGRFTGQNISAWSGNKAVTLRQDGSDTFLSNKANFVGNGAASNGLFIINGESGVRLKYGNAGSSGTDALIVDANGNVGIGTSSPGVKLDVNGTIRSKIVEITGADLAEKFLTSDKVEPGMVVEIDPDNAGKLRQSRGAYNRRVAGVVSGAGKLPAGAILGNLPGHEDAPPIALSGRVWVHCDTSNGVIEPGDLLTTSDTPGQAMKVADYPCAQGAIIGKAMTGLADGRGLVLVLVSLQ
ncbi:MAG: hypothetical protein AMXMBFR20_33750 [Planctomycetia bacterium]